MIEDADIGKIVRSNRVPLDNKCFEYLIRYKAGKKIRPLCAMLPKMSAYKTDFDETKYLSFLIKRNC